MELSLHRITSVVTSCTNQQMLRVDALLVVTGMTNLLTNRNLHPVCLFPGMTMCQHLHTIDSHLTVSTTVQWTRTWDAVHPYQLVLVRYVSATSSGRTSVAN